MRRVLIIFLGVAKLEFEYIDWVCCCWFLISWALNTWIFVPLEFPVTFWWGIGLFVIVFVNTTRSIYRLAGYSSHSSLSSQAYQIFWILMIAMNCSFSRLPANSWSSHTSIIKLSYFLDYHIYFGVINFILHEERTAPVLSKSILNSFRIAIEYLALLCLWAVILFYAELLWDGLIHLLLHSM